MEEAETVVARKLAEKKGVDPDLAEAITKLAEKDDRFKKALASIGILGEQLRSFPEPMQQQVGQPLAGLLFYGLSKDMFKDDDAEFLEKISKMKLAVELLKDEDGKKKDDDTVNVYKELYESLKEELKEYRKMHEEAVKKLDELKEELEKKELEREKEELLEVIRKQEDYIKTLEAKIDQLEEALRNPPQPIEKEDEKPKSPVDQIKEFKQQIEALTEALELLGYKVHKGEEMDLDSLINKLKKMGFEVKAPQMTLQELQKKLEEEREKAKKEAYQETEMFNKLLNTVLGHFRPILEKGIESFSKAWAEVKKEETKVKLMLMAQQVQLMKAQAQTQPPQVQEVRKVNIPVEEVKHDDQPVGGEESGVSTSNETSEQPDTEGN